MKIEIFIMRAVEVVFFTGIVGCAAVVIISWISIFAEGFSNNDKPEPQLRNE